MTLAAWGGSALIQRIITWKGLHLTWEKGGHKNQKKSAFLNDAARASSPLHSCCMWPCIAATMLNLQLLFSALLQELGVFACKYLGEVSVATSIYVFKSLILFADGLMFCS